MKHRSEIPFGEGFRDFVEVCTHETYTLGNIDIIDGLKDGLLQHSYLWSRLNDLSIEDTLHGFVDDMSITDWHDFFRECQTELEHIYNVPFTYVLWLAEEDGVKSYHSLGETPVQDEDIDCYEESPYIISDLGFDGALYAYENIPKPICTLAEYKVKKETLTKEDRN